MINQVLEAIGLARNDEENSEDQALEQAYDDFQRPPKIEIAVKHAAATKFAMIDANIDLDNTNVCPCCGQPVIIIELPLCSSRKDFSFNGSGVALYFDFLVFSIIISAMLAAICSSYGIYDNYYNGNRCQYEANNTLAVCKDDFYNMFSRSNVQKDLDVLASILNCVALATIMITTLYYRNHINTIAQELDDAAILASDYSIIVENIPRNASESEIKAYFSQDFMGNPVELRKVCIGYEIQHYLALEVQKLALQSKVTMILELEAAGKKVPPGFDKDQLQREAKKLNDEQDHLEDNLETSFMFSGTAVISYNREKQADWVCEEHKATRFNLLLHELFGMNFEYKKFGDNLLVIKKAPEPGDIIWGNLGITVSQQFKRILKTNLMTFFVLIMAFAMIFGLSYAQVYIGQQMDENSTLAIAIVNLLGIVASLFISVVNAILNKSIIKFAEMEQHSTKTEYDISVAKKLGIAQFLNTAILTLLVNFLIKDSNEPLSTTMWKPGGLNSDVMLIFITNSIVPWAMQLFDPGYFYKVYVRNKIIKEGKACKYSQREANLAFEGPKIDLSSKYAILTKTLMMAFFYAYLLPLGVIFTFVSLICLYWTEKFLLLKRDAKPPPTGSAMAEAMIEFYIELVLIVYSVGCCIWEYVLFQQLHWISWLQLILSALYYVLPEEKIFACIIETGRDNATVESYDEKYITFPDDYDRRNPVTLDKAKEAWMRLQQETVTAPTPNPSTLIQLKKPIQQTQSIGQLSHFSSNAAKVHPEPKTIQKSQTEQQQQQYQLQQIDE